MNKKGLSKIERIGIGVILGTTGLIITAWGSTLNNILMLRVGLVTVTLSGWLISWN